MLDLENFEQTGFAIARPFLSLRTVNELISVIESAAKPDKRRGGTRDVLDLAPELRALADHSTLKEMLAGVLGKEAFVVRATLFDKTDAANWMVPWHQDLTIAVQQRFEVDGYGPWSVKAGVQHVQPPTEVLDRMLTIRVHLDPCPASNGALRVQPGTHKLGRLNQNYVSHYIDESSAVICEVESGGALLMRPLLLHASSPSAMPSHRRVVHFDFAMGDLADGLRWRTL